MDTRIEDLNLPDKNLLIHNFKKNNANNKLLEKINLRELTDNEAMYIVDRIFKIITKKLHDEKLRIGKGGKITHRLYIFVVSSVIYMNN